MDEEIKTKMIQKIKEEWDKGDLPYIEAILELEKLGFTPTSAEIIVSEWEDGSEP